MSALPQDDLPPRPRALSPAGRAAVLRALDGLRRRPPAAPLHAHPTYRYGDREIPAPPALGRYLRGDRQFARLLGVVVDRVYGRADREHPAPPFTGYRRRCAELALALMADHRPRDDGRAVGINDPVATGLLLELFPPVPCGACGAPFLRDTTRRRHCSEACRRKADGRHTGAGSPQTALDACQVCGGPLTGMRRRNCSRQCARRAKGGCRRAEGAA